MTRTSARPDTARLVLFGLTGCRVEGRVVVRPDDRLDVDLTVHAKRSPYCNADLVGLSVIAGRDADGVVLSCRYLGTIDPTVFGYRGVSVTSAGEVQVATFNPLLVPAAGAPTIINDVEALDVVIVTAGDIVEANAGVVAGKELTLADPASLGQPGGVRVLALRHAGPASWVWWALGGAVAGAVATLLVPLVLRPADFRVGGTAESAPDDDRPEARSWTKPSCAARTPHSTSTRTKPQRHLRRIGRHEAATAPTRPPPQSRPARPRPPTRAGGRRRSEPECDHGPIRRIRAVW